MKHALLAFLLLVPTLSYPATIGVSLQILPIEQIEVISATQVHVRSNTGRQVETQFFINGAQYALTNCDLTPGHYIDTTCDLTPVVTVPLD